MAAVTDETLRSMTEIIVKEVKPRQIILFGSHARGNAGPESDVDLLIIEDEPFGPGRSRRKEMVKLWRILIPFRFAKDILVYSQDELQRWRHSINHVLSRALREGKILYERH